MLDVLGGIAEEAVQVSRLSLFLYLMQDDFGRLVFEIEPIVANDDIAPLLNFQGTIQCSLDRAQRN